jgi:ABC-type transport system substrate-binding protein
VQKSREEARNILKSLGYGPDKRLAVKISARNLAIYRDPATILTDQLKQIWIDAEIELIETANWLPKLMRGILFLHRASSAVVSTIRTRTSMRITSVTRTEITSATAIAISTK